HPEHRDRLAVDRRLLDPVDAENRVLWKVLALDAVRNAAGLAAAPAAHEEDDERNRSRADHPEPHRTELSRLARGRWTATSTRARSSFAASGFPSRTGVWRHPHRRRARRPTSWAAKSSSRRRC